MKKFMPDMHDGELDDLFRKAAEGYTSAEKEEVWNSLEAKLDAKSGNRKPKAAWWKFVVAFLLLGTAGYLIWQYDDTGMAGSKLSSVPSTENNKNSVPTPIESILDEPNNSIKDSPADNQASQKEHTSYQSDGSPINSEKVPGKTTTNIKSSGKLSQREDLPDRAGVPPNRNATFGISRVEKTTLKPSSPNSQKKKPTEKSPVFNSKYPVPVTKNETANVRNEAANLRNEIPGIKSQIPATKKEPGDERNEDSKLINGIINAKHLPSGINDELPDTHTKPKNELLLAKVDSPIAGLPDSLTKKYASDFKIRHWQIGLTAGPEWSGLPGNAWDIGLSGGLKITYRINKKWALVTGALVSKKMYKARPKDYNPVDDYWRNYDVRNIDAECLIWDIPLNVEYTIWNDKSNAIQLSTGLSSIWMAEEKYTYFYKTSSGSWDQWTKELYGKNHHLFSILNVSAGYIHKWRRFSLQAAPYLKLPLKGIGYGRVKLYSTGIQLTLQYHGRK